MRVDTSNESPSSQLSFGVSTSIWLFSCEKHVTVKVVLKTEAAENRSSDSTRISWASAAFVRPSPCQLAVS